MPQSQDQLIQALAEPALYPHKVGRILHIQTHISHVFLTGDYAYKLKKPLDLGFLNFSSLEQRIFFCREELRLNRRLAPSVYLRVMALVRSQNGFSLRPLDEVEPGLVLEPVLQMSQMQPARQMDRLLAQGGVAPEHIRALAALMADFYPRAERGPEVEFYGRLEQVRVNVEENFTQTESFREVMTSPARWQGIKDYSLEFMGQNRELFERRVREGRIVDGHGDLHSGNINLPEIGAPLVFDCIEFNRRFRFQDAACDLAFLAMDLDFHQRRDLSSLLIDTYTKLSGDKGLAEILEFYKCYRAVVRAKIHGFTYEQPGQEVERRYSDLDKARDYFRLAAHTGWPHISSDLVRKQSAGLSANSRAKHPWGQGLYNERNTRKTYQALLFEARSRLAGGDSAIVDASFRDDHWRERFLMMARETGARCLFVEVTAEPRVLRERLQQREAAGNSVSDGRLELLEHQMRDWQKSDWLGDERRIKVDGSKNVQANLMQILARLEEWGHASWTEQRA